MARDWRDIYGTAEEEEEEDIVGEDEVVETEGEGESASAHRDRLVEASERPGLLGQLGAELLSIYDDKADKRQTEKLLADVAAGNGDPADIRAAVAVLAHQEDIDSSEAVINETIRAMTAAGESDQSISDSVAELRRGVAALDELRGPSFDWAAENPELQAAALEKHLQDRSDAFVTMLEDESRDEVAVAQLYVTAALEQAADEAAARRVEVESV